MVEKIRTYLKKHTIQTIVLLVLVAAIGIMLWRHHVYLKVNQSSATESITNEQATSDAGEKTASEDRPYEYTSAGIIYHTASGAAAGPFVFLYTDDFEHYGSTIARYIGDNGKYGYLNKDGSLLTEPIFIDAVAFQNGTARVSRKAGKIYYINKEAERITKDYSDGIENYEMQGHYCRVQLEDGTWGIITREDKIVFSGADMIEELPFVTSLGSAVVDGKAVLLQLDPDDEDEEVKVIASYDEFIKISQVYGEDFAYVWTADDKMGVVDYKGDVIVPAEYQKIEHAYVGEDIESLEHVFLAHDENGIVKVWRFLNCRKTM